MAGQCWIRKMTGWQDAPEPNPRRKALITYWSWCVPPFRRFTLPDTRLSPLAWR
ncbi:hypothetical protein MLPF_0489 [Mycobacterium lepromatosis]|nr:hypothetical protein MLPF_0489 [Mycobacterium lepromatosis]